MSGIITAWESCLKSHWYRVDGLQHWWNFLLFWIAGFFVVLVFYFNTIPLGYCLPLADLPLLFLQHAEEKTKNLNERQFSSVQLLSHVPLFATLWVTACQASLSITKSRSLLKLMSTESVMPSSHLILCRPLLLLPPIPPSIRVFSNESALLMRWPKYWSFSFSISPSNEYPGLISFER